jgi:type IV pilus assembly protein PilC
MITMMLVVIIVLISKVLPIFNQVFIQLGSEMNSFSQGLMNIGNIINRSSIGIIVFLVICVILYFISIKTSFGKALSRKFFVSSIFTKNFANHIAAGRFASGMALTLESGLDTYHSLDMVAELVDNPNVAKQIKDCKANVTSGDNFSEALTKSGIFSNLYIRMISVGFKTGSLDVVMRKIADHYDKETEKKIHSVISVLEPTLVISLSVIVGMILLSVILPLMGIMSSIG